MMFLSVTRMVYRQAQKICTKMVEYKYSLLDAEELEAEVEEEKKEKEEETEEEVVE